MKYRLSLANTLTFLMIASIAAGSGVEASTPATHASNTQTISALKNNSSSVLSKLEALDLTTEQSDEIEAIQANMTAQIADILTPAQMSSLEQGRAEGEDLRTVMRGLGLDRAQRSEVMTLMRGVQEQIMAVLTPEQREQMQADRSRNRKQRNVFK
ncbi:MAG: Spy/CpxP family protein refolding chaperone [Cyanobacteria bacterium P01_D01_bin.105]